MLVSPCSAKLRLSTRMAVLNHAIVILAAAAAAGPAEQQDMLCRVVVGGVFLKPWRFAYWIFAFFAVGKGRCQ